MIKKNIVPIIMQPKVITDISVERNVINDPEKKIVIEDVVVAKQKRINRIVLALTKRFDQYRGLYNLHDPNVKKIFGDRFREIDDGVLIPRSFIKCYERSVNNSIFRSALNNAKAAPSASFIDVHWDEAYAMAMQNGPYPAMAITMIMSFIFEYLASIIKVVADFMGKMRLHVDLFLFSICINPGIILQLIFYRIFYYPLLAVIFFIERAPMNEITYQNKKTKEKRILNFYLESGQSIADDFFYPYFNNVSRQHPLENQREFAGVMRQVNSYMNGDLSGSSGPANGFNVGFGSFFSNLGGSGIGLIRHLFKFGGCTEIRNISYADREPRPFKMRDIFKNYSPNYGQIIETCYECSSELTEDECVAEAYSMTPIDKINVVRAINALEGSFIKEDMSEFDDFHTTVNRTGRDLLNEFENVAKGIANEFDLNESISILNNSYTPVDNSTDSIKRMTDMESTLKEFDRALTSIEQASYIDITNMIMGSNKEGTYDPIRVSKESGAKELIIYNNKRAALINEISRYKLSIATYGNIKDKEREKGYTELVSNLDALEKELKHIEKAIKETEKDLAEIRPDDEVDMNKFNPTTRKLFQGLIIFVLDNACCVISYVTNMIAKKNAARYADASAWRPDIAYKVDDLVGFGDVIYKCLKESKNMSPDGINFNDLMWSKGTTEILKDKNLSKEEIDDKIDKMKTNDDAELVKTYWVITDEVTKPTWMAQMLYFLSHFDEEDFDKTKMGAGLSLIKNVLNLGLNIFIIYSTDMQLAMKGKFKMNIDFDVVKMAQNMGILSAFAIVKTVVIYIDDQLFFGIMNAAKNNSSFAKLINLIAEGSCLTFLSFFDMITDVISKFYNQLMIFKQLMAYKPKMDFMYEVKTSFNMPKLSNYFDYLIDMILKLFSFWLEFCNINTDLNDTSMDYIRNFIMNAPNPVETVVLYPAVFEELNKGVRTKGLAGYFEAIYESAKLPLNMDNKFVNYSEDIKTLVTESAFAYEDLKSTEENIAKHFVQTENEMKRFVDKEKE